MTPRPPVRPAGAVTRVCYVSRASPRRGRPIPSDTGLESGSRGEPRLRREGDLLHAPGGGGQRRPARRAATIRRLQSVVRTRARSRHGTVRFLRHGLRGYGRPRRRAIRLERGPRPGRGGGLARGGGGCGGGGGGRGPAALLLSGV